MKQLRIRKPLGVTLRANLKDRIVRIAQEEQTTISAVVETLLDEALRNTEKTISARRLERLVERQAGKD